MIKTYPKNTINKKMGCALIVMYLGVAVGFVCLFATEKMQFFIQAVLWGLILSTILVWIWYCRSVFRIFKRCEGEVLEIQEGVVVMYHDKPFVYKREELYKGCFSTTLVPFEAKPISATQTLRVPVYGNVLSYKLHCVVMVCDFQAYYDSFLSLNRIGTVEKIVEACIGSFLYHNRMWFVELYQDESGEALRDEYVRGATKRDAEIYMQEELSKYGLMVYKALPTCRFEPVTID